MTQQLLTTQQVQELFKFTEKKFVRYYDLQVELVDHLATSIEEEWQNDPSISFEQALQKVYSRFGIFGFSKVVQERQAALLKQNRRIWYSCIREFFTIPKILFTACVFFLSLFIANFFTPDGKGWIVYGLWLVFTIVEVRLMVKARKGSIKNLLLTQYNSFFSMGGMVIPYYLFITTKLNIHNNLLFAALVTVVVVIEGAIIQLNRQVRQKARDLYPEAFKLA